MKRARQRASRAATTKEWAVLVFMVPDERLEQAARDDIEEMRSVDVLDDLHVVVQVDHARNPERLVIANGECQRFEARAYGKIAPDLKDFLSWALANYQARRYALILWGHGQGVGTRLSRPAPFADLDGQLRFQDLRQLLPGIGVPEMTPFVTLSTSVGTYVLPPSLRPIRAAGTTEQVMSVADTAKAVSEALGSRKLDILGFDACFMAGIETTVQFKDTAHLLIASQDFVPDEGWDYHEVLTRMGRAPGNDRDAVATDILEHVSDIGGLSNLSVVALAHAGEMSTRLAQLVKALRDSIERGSDDTLRVQMLCDRALSLRARQMIDLIDLCERLRDDFEETTADPLDRCVYDAAEALLATLHAATEYSADAGLAGRLNGVSIFYEHVHAGVRLPGDSGPPQLNVQIHDREYGALDLVKASQWLKLLHQLAPAGERA